MKVINFWNGNKTPVRKGYELELLKLCLQSTEKDFGVADLRVDKNDYPLAIDESNIFDNGTDILITVAGNLKFSHKEKTMIARPLAKGLLGCRLVLANKDKIALFEQLENVEQLKKYSIGIPETWADAEILRQNGFNVIERGAFENLFSQLKDQVFDYTALGAIEVEQAYKIAKMVSVDIAIESTVMIYYPLPLVFYINVSQPELANRVEIGLKKIQSNGQFQQLFDRHYGACVERLKLKSRRVFKLGNPFVPKELEAYRSSLLF
jgi:hypothetical protein